MARTVVAGNWKMHKTPTEACAFFDELPALPGGAPDVLVFPPAVSLQAAAQCPARPDRVRIGAQNVHWEAKGAFTGESSVSMVADAGASHVLVGHSERRHVFGETDDDVARKVEAVLGGGLAPVVCVGETLEERRTGRVEAVILRQLAAVLRVVGADPSAFLLAYEPVWAIGTGETATPEDASAAHATLRERLGEAFGGPDGAARVPILYGGSVKPGNAADLMAAPDVDGVLVGGASLDPASFAAIVDAGA